MSTSNEEIDPISDCPSLPVSITIEPIPPLAPCTFADDRKNRSRHRSRITFERIDAEPISLSFQFHRGIPGIMMTHTTGYVDSSWLDRAHSLEKQGMVSASLDVVFEKMDRMLCQGDFEQCDAIFEAVHPRALSVNVIVGLLTVTNLAQDKLASRKAFGEKARFELVCRQHTDVKALLDGLT
jgi:hypothetical protein